MLMIKKSGGVSGLLLLSTAGHKAEILITKNGNKERENRYAFIDTGAYIRNLNSEVVRKTTIIIINS